MNLGTLIPLITAVAPFATGVIKKIFQTEDLENKKAIHQIIPLAIGLIAGVLNNFIANGEWKTAIIAGLAGGAGASYVRDFDKNVLGVFSALAKILKK